VPRPLDDARDDAAGPAPGGVEPAPAPVRARIDPSAVAALLDAYSAATADEPCGLLFGERDGAFVSIREAPSLENVHPSPDRSFLLDPDEQQRAIRERRDRGLELVGTWHGHVRGGPFPGQQDLEGVLAAHAGIVVIVGRGTRGRAVMRAYVPTARDAKEIPLSV
jgi:proteasome lid subunit RPN8/RPN11